MASRARRLIVLATAAPAALLLVAALLHTPFARSQVLDWIARDARTRFGVELEADRLDYNLGSLSFRLVRVRLKATGEVRLKPDTTDEDEGRLKPAPTTIPPFFEADEITLDLPWSALGGTFGIESVQLARPRVNVVREQDGTLNLPTPRPRGTGGLDRLPIGRVSLTDATASYVDAGREFALEASGLDVDLRGTAAASGIAGPLLVRRGLRLRLGVHETTTTRFDARIAYDGATLALEPLVLVSAEGTLELRGRMSLLAGEPSIEATYSATPDVGWLAAWWPAVGSLAGTLGVTGRVAGPFARPTVTAEFVGGVAGGTITGSGRFFGADGPARHIVTCDYQGLDLTRVLSAVRIEPPVSLRAWLGGRGEASWSGAGRDGLRLTIENDARPLTSPRGALRRPLGVEGHLALHVDRGRWVLKHAHTLGEAIEIAGVAEGRLDAAGLGRSSLAGETSVRARNLAGALAALDAAGLATGAFIEAALDGDARAELSLSGTLADPRAIGTVEGVDFRTITSGPSHLTARIDLDGRRLQAGDLDVSAGGNRLRGAVRVTFANQTLDGELRADLSDAPAWLRVLPARWRPAGSFSVAGRLSGTVSEPRLDVGVEGRHLELAGQQADRGGAEVSLIGGTVFVVKASVTQREGGHLGLEGRYDARSRGYVIDAAGVDLEVRPLPALADAGPSRPIAGRIRAVGLRGEGSLDRPAGRGQLDIARLDIGRFDIGAATINLEIEQGRARGNALLPDLRLSAEASTRLAAPYPFALTAHVDEGDLARWMGVAVGEGHQVSGALGFDLEAAGDLANLAAADAELVLARADLAVGLTRLSLTEPARLRYASGQLAARDVEFRSGKTTIRMDGLLAARTEDSTLALALEGDLVDVGPWVRQFVAPDLDAHGALRARVTATGTVARPIVTGDLGITGARISLKDLPAATAVGLRAAYRDGVLDVSDLSGQWQGATVAAAGRLPAALFGRWLPKRYLDSLPSGDRAARLAARIAPLTKAVLAPWLDPATLAEIEADAAATLTAEADALALDRVRGELAFDRVSLSLARAPFEQQRPTRLTLADGRLSVADWAWGGPQSQLTVVGDLRLEAGAPLDLRVRGSSDLRLLGAVIPGAAAAGQAALDVRIHGAARDPDLSGVVTITSGELRFRYPRLSLADLSGTIELANDRLEVHNMTGSANGGAVRLDGELAHDRLSLTSGALGASGQGMALEWPKGLRTELAGDLTLKPSADGATIAGKVVVHRGAYRDPVVLTTQVLEALRSSAAAAPGAERASWLDRLRLDVAVTTREDVEVDNNYGQFEIGADLRLVGSLGSPALAGRVTMREGGRLFLGGNVYRVERGTIDFVDPLEIKPDVHLTARTRVSSYDITLSANGTPDTLTAELTSDDPSLTRGDLVSLLLTGQRATDVRFVDSPQVRAQMITLLSGDLLGLAGQRVGFDAVRLERGGTDDLFGADPALVAAETADPATRLSLTKRLSRQVEVVLSQSLREHGGLTWIAVWRPGREFEVRGVARDDTSKSLELSQRFTLGDGQVAPRPVDRAERSRVAEVRITGTPGVAEPELRSRLTLGAGDRFDVGRWQDDREALERFYRERGHLEARVGARRAEAGSGASRTVVLEYVTDAGPRTELVVEGYQLSARLRRELDDTWADAVFDGFLLDDLRARTATALARDGYLRADIAADLGVRGDVSPPVKAVRLRVTPGPRTTVRAIEFHGNARISTDRLQMLVRQRGLEVAAWLVPADLASAVADLYAGEGLLAASITVGTPRFAGDSALLPVTIVEGPAFEVSEVRIEGARARAEADVRTAFAVQPGSAYQPPRIEEGRRAAEAGYRRDGYNEVRTRVAREIDRARGRVALSLVVTEGPRQVLAGVDVEGARATRADVVARAIRAAPGRPIDLDEWYQARTRLYDTGVFRSADIRFEPVPGSPAPGGAIQPVRAKVTLDEWPPYRVRYGFQVGDQIDPVADERQRTVGVIADLQRRNAFGRAITAGLVGRYETDLWVARAYASTPRFFGLPLASSLYLTRSSETVEPSGGVGFVTDKTAVSLQQEARTGRTFRVTYGYQFERNHVFDPDASPDDPFAIEFKINIARLTGALLSDTRNDPFDPSRGWFSSSTLEYGAEAIGSELRFVKFLAQESFFHQIGAVVVASGVRLGGVRGLEGQLIVPSERFFVGGANTVRGYAEESLGPVGLLGDPAGGNALLVFNQELRFPIYRWMRGVAFIDAGNVFEFVRDVRLTDLKVGIGGGLRLDTPFAMVRLDLGVPIRRRPTDARGRWYFSLGHVF